MKTLLRTLWFPLKYILWLLLSPLVTVAYILLILTVGLPSHLFRKVVSFFGHILDHDLESLLSGMSSFVFRDFEDLYTKPSHSCTLVLKLKGHCELSALQQHVLHNAVHKWNPREGRQEYPELRQYCTTRLGYPFFKRDRQFDISNHVKLYKHGENNERRVVTDDQLMSIRESLARAPYMPKRSPWEFLLVENYIPGKEGQRSVLIIRFHHSLMDGLAMYKILLEIMDHGSVPWEKVKPTLRRLPKFYNPIQYLHAILLGPASGTFLLLQGLDYSNALHYKKNGLSGKYHIVESTLDLSTIKKAKDLQRVSFSAIVIAGITGGIRSYLIRNGLKFSVFPMRFGIPVPVPNHSGKLGNEWLPGVLSLPIDMKLAKDRLQCVDQRLKKLQRGAMASFLSLSVRMIGGFPVKWIRFLTNNSPITVLFSEMRCQEQTIGMMSGDVLMEEISASFGLGPDDLGIGCSTISYVGKLKIVLTLDTGIFVTKEEADQFSTFIINEIQEFQNIGCPFVKEK